MPNNIYLIDGLLTYAKLVDEELGSNTFITIRQSLDDLIGELCDSLKDIFYENFRKAEIVKVKYMLDLGLGPINLQDLIDVKGIQIDSGVVIGPLPPQPYQPPPFLYGGLNLGFNPLSYKSKLTIYTKEIPNEAFRMCMRALRLAHVLECRWFDKAQHEFFDKFPLVEIQDKDLKDELSHL